MTATPTLTITVDDLTRIYAGLDAGLDPEELFEVLQAEKPAAPAPKKPTVMVTEFPDGVVIGWDHCSECNRHVTKCECKGGPKELRVFEKWRNGDKAMPEYGKPAATTTASAPPAAAPTKAAPKKAAVHPDGQVVCKDHNDFVPVEEAEKNDDGTWTCFRCQESSTGGVQVDG